jgi:hypothetical protein
VLEFAVRVSVVVEALDGSGPVVHGNGTTTALFPMLPPRRR